MIIDIAWYLDALAARDMQRAGSDSLPDAPAATSFNARLKQALTSPDEAATVVDFWRDAGPERWFAKDADFDHEFRERFLSRHEAAARGELTGWNASPYERLGLVLLLDQFPRNAFRGTPRMYATDTLALHVACAAIDAGHDREVQPDLQLFFYLPFAHSENLSDQERSVALCRRLGEPNLSHAERHRDIIRRFGRFPHRNPILRRPMTDEEQRFLDDGGFSG
ncbi:MAG TPA: DUF924 family protein [Azospirillum sp.]|nr:DUF924 family protein [Azospirillum sp.]